MSCRELLAFGESELLAAGVEEAALDAWLLLSHATGISRASYLMDPDRPVKKEAEAGYRQMIALRRTRKPLQYITGVQEFMGLSFLVNPSVLIPRQDTEILVEQILKENTGGTVLDMCTGSGCIGVSLAVLGEFFVTAADISRDALKTAGENARRNGCQSRVKLVETDLFSALSGQSFDIIASNPPYIPSQVIEELMPEVREYEPRLALDGTQDGLWFYRVLAAKGKEYLNPQGRMYLEIGESQASAVEGFLKEQGFKNVETIKDLAGLDRVVRADRP